MEFLDKIKIKKPIHLGTNLEIQGMLDQILKYDIYSKIETLDTIHKDESYISIYRSYKKYNDKISNSTYTQILMQAINSKISSSYYQSYIEDGYKEGSSEISVELTKKYKVKIQNLDSELNKLIESIVKNNEI